MAGDLATARSTLDRAREHLLGLQSPEGFWKGELETNVTMDAEDLLLREFLGIRTPEQSEETAVWIRSQQRSDGSWATFYEGPADLSTTLEAYVALRLAGDDPSQPHMAKAAAFVREAGGLERARVFTRLWMALFGLWPWDELPGAAARGRLPAVLVPAQHLRLRVLGPSDDRRAHRRGGPPAGPAASFRDRRAPDRGCRRRPSSPGGRPRVLSSAWTTCCTAGRGWRGSRCSGRPCGRRLSSRPSAGSSSGRRPTADGAASSRHGSIR